MQLIMYSYKTANKNRLFEKKTTDKEMQIINVFKPFYYMTIIYVKSNTPQSWRGIK